MASDSSCDNFNNTSFTFKWILENFPYCSQKDGLVLVSPTFIVNTMERTKWHLELSPKKIVQSEAYIALCLRREEDSKGPASLILAIEISLLASDGSVLKSRYSSPKTYMNDTAWGFNDFVERKSVFAQRSTYMPRETLIIKCRMRNIESQRFLGYCIARTRIGVERKTFPWRIQICSLVDEHQETFLTLKSTSDDQKIMILKFSFGNKLPNDDVFIFFRNLNKNFEVSTFKASLLNTQGDLLDCGTCEILYPLSEFNSRYKIPLSKSRLIHDKYLYFPNNVLTLYCEFAYATGDVYEGIEETSDEFIGSSINCDVETAKIKCSEYPDLKMDIRAMLRNSTLCDVNLCVEGQTFQAHWFVLIARSPVFRAMYESDMKEKIKSQIHITDLRPETFRLMLHYLYTDELGELNWGAASELFTAADKYLILPLKVKCSSFLKNNLHCENACKVLLLSDKLQDKELKVAAQSFILKNDKIIFKSSEWKHFMEANLNLALETMLLRYEE